MERKIQDHKEKGGYTRH